MTRRTFCKAFLLLFTTKLWAKGKRPNTLKYLLTHKPEPFKLGEEAWFKKDIRRRARCPETSKADSEILERIMELHNHFRPVRFDYRSDWKMFGKRDHWVLPKKKSWFFRREFYAGDCEDHSILIEDRLSTEGIYVDYIICETETKESHMVASWNGYIIDQRQAGIVPRQDLNYNYQFISEANGVNWKKIIN